MYIQIQWHFIMIGLADARICGHRNCRYLRWMRDVKMKTEAGRKGSARADWEALLDDEVWWWRGGDGDGQELLTELGRKVSMTGCTVTQSGRSSHKGWLDPRTVPRRLDDLMSCTFTSHEHPTIEPLKGWLGEVEDDGWEGWKREQCRFAKGWVEFYWSVGEQRSTTSFSHLKGGKVR